MLRLERVAAKKAFFAEFYREKRKQEFETALGILATKKDSDAGRAYRFESLRQEAEVHLASGNAEKAEAAYRVILEKYEFPWARAGVAKSLHRQNRLSEAREEIEKVVAAAPNYFDASDVKANICMAQGEHEEAQKVLDAAAKKTPRNYLRKRLLAEAAELNGDIETARAAMADVVANDTMPGAVSTEDQLSLARAQVGANDLISAEKVLLLMRESEVMNMALAQQASYSALLAVASPEKGTKRFAGLRPALIASPLPSIARVDILRAALVVDDNELADGQARELMSGEDAKKVFGTVRKLYALRGRESDFREIQRRVALQRIHHDDPPPEG
jgi:predicted Zn-dependent protease